MAKILAFLIDFVTLGIGAGVLVGYALNNRDEECARVGAAMIVLGLLIRERRAAPKKSVESHGQIAKPEENEIERKARMFDEMNSKISASKASYHTRSSAASCSTDTRTLRGCLMVIRSRKGRRIGAGTGR